MKIDEFQSEDSLRILAVRTNRNENNSVIKLIKKQLPENTKIISVGNKDTDIVMTGLIRIKRKRGRIKNLIKEDRFSGASHITQADKTLNESTFVGIDHLQRRTEQFAWRHHTVNNTYDAKNYYHVAVDLLANLLAKEQINLVLFFEIPHLFYDTLIYQVAKFQGIRTLVVTSSQFPNRFFSLSAIEDVGNFPLERSENSKIRYPINPDENPEWEYMEGVLQFRGEPGKLNWRGILQLFWTLVAVERTKLLKPKIVSKTIGRMRIIAATLPKWRYPFRRYLHTSHLDYYEKLLLYENKEIDFSRKFVYFPLQFQPEMTTSTLGGCFSDQLLAIEHLFSILPDDCWIYVKENPKQNGAMRGPQFFNRLGRIPNLTFLPSYANTYELIDKSEFVAAITGTVGWEAICKGKNVLVFGMPWYRNLPGVVQFREGITYEKILNCKNEHSTLEQQTGRLVSRSHSVDAQPPTTHTTRGDNSESNTVAEAIVNLIENRIDTTFL